MGGYSIMRLQGCASLSESEVAVASGTSASPTPKYLLLWHDAARTEIVCTSALVHHALFTTTTLAIQASRRPAQAVRNPY